MHTGTTQCSPVLSPCVASTQTHRDFFPRPPAAIPPAHTHGAGAAPEAQPGQPRLSTVPRGGDGGGPSARGSGRAAPSAPGPPGRLREQPPRSPVPVVDVGGVGPLLHDPARVSLPPLGHRDRDCRLRSKRPWKLLEPPRRLPPSARRGPFRHAPGAPPRLIGSARLVGSAALQAAWGWCSRPVPSPPAYSSRSQPTVPRAPIPIAGSDTVPPHSQAAGTGSPKASHCGLRGTPGLVVRERGAAAPHPAGELHVPACSARGCPTPPCPAVSAAGAGGAAR